MRGARLRPIIRQTTAVKRGDHLPPRCEHGEWRFAGSDAKRGASKWRCPTGDCQPASRWLKADRLHPLIPRGTLRQRKLYKGRASVEREFGRLKHEWSLLPLRVRGLDRVRLHADLTILAKLACALARARATPLAAQAAHVEKRVGSPQSRHAPNEKDHVSLLWIIIIVIVVLAVLGYFGRGRFSRQPRPVQLRFASRFAGPSQGLGERGVLALTLAGFVLALGTLAVIVAQP